MESAFGIVAAAVGTVFVRIGWARGRTLAWGGWALIALAMTLLGTQAGAWGVAIAATSVMATALLLLAQAGWVAPAGRVRAARESPSITLPKLRIGAVGRRLAVFALVVPVGLAATALLGFGAQAAARRGGWHEADSTVLMLFLQPTAWGLLASIQMTRRGPGAMIMPALLAAAAGLLLWWPA